jgi:hypothetical protein
VRVATFTPPRLKSILSLNPATMFQPNFDRHRFDGRGSRRYAGGRDISYELGVMTVAVSVAWLS